MNLRQIEIVIPEDERDSCSELLSDESVLHYWRSKSEGSGYMLKVLVEATKAEQFLDKVEQMFDNRDDFRLVMVSVDATIPRIKKDEEEESEEKKEKDKTSDKPWEKPLQKGIRVSREELYSDIAGAVELTRVYMALVILSTIVATFGVLRDNTAVVVGAMVIAPLLGPNVGLALSSVLADLKLGIESLKSNITGLLVALFISVAFGVFMDVDSEIYHIASRTEVHMSDIALALASGAAGVLAYTVGMSTAVIGVMVAVALLPPLVVAGLLLGDMQLDLAYYALLLTLTNVICVNLAGVATFILQGVGPRTWYETKRAKKVNRIVLFIWILLIIILGAVIYFA
ncbi:TIGR00341 family protein [Rhodohalobacter sp. SW132]|uniref:TIGR00341 family protein n=1 Tax=Rhodohalobacter sp. SW132 TaxID=2293433 RepID=UPI000E2600D7|nr:TIGR00341 family protein [Rhodohalobacter sp. SW132]REL39009.1 TIGR00341 family protein [Rhodohalobacter sp. SW132]